MKYRPTLSIVTLIAASLLTGCASSMKQPPDNGPSLLVVTSCPPLAPLLDPSLGAAVLKLVEWAAQYRECRNAALGGVAP